MNKKTIVLILAMLGVSTAVVVASSTGYGIPSPAKKPISIREGSPKTDNRSGHFRTRYFLGGGLHRGK